MKEHLLRVGLQSAAVAILFATCGALSSTFLLSTFPNQFDPVFPIPFALLCALLWMRTIRGAFAFSLMVVVWLVSTLGASLVGMGASSFFLPGFVGGLIGSIGLVLCAAICYPSLFSWKYFALGILIGSLSGTCFEPWTQAYNAARFSGFVPKDNAPRTAFAIWEAAVGTYLYAICAHGKWRIRGDDSHGKPDHEDGIQTLFSADKEDANPS